MNVDNKQPPIEKINNKNHVADIEYAVQHTRWILTVLGVWPFVSSNSTKVQKFVARFYMPFPSISIIMLLTQILTFMVLRDVRRAQIIVLLGQIAFRAANILKNWILIARRDTIKCCIQHMETDWRRIENDNEREIMTRNVRGGHGLTLLCTGFMYGSGIFYQVIMPLMKGKTVNEFNVTVRPLRLPGAEIFVDLQAGYNYEIVFCSHCLVAFYLYSIVIAICDLAAITVSHACGQIEIVMTRLENLTDGGNDGDDGLAERIAWIVRCHVRVLRFAATIEEMLRDMCLVEVVSNTLVICWLEYCCMTEWKNKNPLSLIPFAMLLISLCFNIFILCHIGQILKDRCLEIGKATYMIDWYRLPSKTGLSLIMVIAMAQYPRSLTAGRMIELTIYSFGSIMKTTVAYLNMLRAMAE